MYYGREFDFDNDILTIDIVNDEAISTGNVYIPNLKKQEFFITLIWLNQNLK